MLGVVLTPENYLEGLYASADWYDIVIYDAIAQIGVNQIIMACYQGNTAYCPFITGSPNGTGGFGEITGVNSYNLNVGSL